MTINNFLMPAILVQIVKKKNEFSNRDWNWIDGFEKKPYK